MPPALIHSLVIERATNGTEDDRGMPTQAWATAATIPGLVQQKHAEELAQLSQGGPVTSLHKAYLPYGADVHEADRIRQGGRLFQVTGIDPDVGGARHHAVADLQLVDV
jgi:SPP1 family predicted phage head-tail adaptor